LLKLMLLRWRYGEERGCSACSVSVAILEKIYSVNWH